MTLYLGDNLISGVTYPIEPTRNLGQIIESILPLTDAGLHLLDGALINGSGIYSAFVDAIADLVTDYPDLFETEANWQSAVTTYGVCGKFVYDSTNNTVRLPKITGILEGTTDATALGDLVEAGLPMSWFEHKHTRGDMDIWGQFDYHVWGAGASGAFYANGKSANKAGAGSDNKCPYTITGFNASRYWVGSTSTPNYTDSSHNNSTVQPQTIKCYYYIVIATTTKTEIEVDIDEVTTDLNNKVDLDGANATFPYIVESYVNGTSWYNIYSNGWCEQGSKGTFSGTTEIVVYLLISFVNTNYAVQATSITHSHPTYVNIVSTSQFNVGKATPNLAWGSGDFFWRASGYIR